MNIEQRSDNDGEDEDKEHTELKGLGQFAHFLEERSDDRKGGDSKDYHQLVERTGNEKRQTCADGEEKNTQTQTGEHSADILFV